MPVCALGIFQPAIVLCQKLMDLLQPWADAHRGFERFDSVSAESPFAVGDHQPIDRVATQGRQFARHR